jgi:hypothetical protein
MYSPLWKSIVTRRCDISTPIKYTSKYDQSPDLFLSDLTKLLLMKKSPFETNQTQFKCAEESHSHIDFNNVTVISETKEYGGECSSCFCRLTVGDFKCRLPNGNSTIICVNCLVVQKSTLNQIEKIGRIGV